jgi:hypothetical protein
VQSVLQRLLSAAAPAGAAGRENRRQCLKVIMNWCLLQVMLDIGMYQYCKSSLPLLMPYSRTELATELYFSLMYIQERLCGYDRYFRV